MQVLEGHSVYICLCHGITDSQIRSCVKEGARSLCDLSGQLGVATQCGSCANHAVELLNEVLTPAPMRHPATVVQHA
jgi:bacterioferritin-associated ferredoxin